MPFRLERTGRFEDDLLDIWDYVASDNLPAADKVIRDIVGRFEPLATFPKLGRAVPEISTEHYVLLQGSYVIVYRVDEEAGRVLLLRVIHGARDWLSLFD
ncbi:type II toxin-antitoxin system RelE/ParE family toxin [Asticcacaulis sp. AND118]|uniref:type II toxin-antitoxin system RelE/ParE family toxin n=1 Tax=Asticcacaulis sp. AND118 TaxID=2840468 RepID=UPI001CFFCAFE|nr:type II toxin-antitoxin system RelE/ParE family toxin [Asticcacaulis sp. AND118]UDF04354.1 type II toxin-antitoxin system RelE/ParE family toxin [Asticcacaulis sp. AND118]